MRRVKRGSSIAVCLVLALIAAGGTSTVLATTTKSPNFEASEAEFGAGAALETCSGEYCASATIGTIGGEASSENFSAAFSEVGEDDEEPLLEIMIEPGVSNLGKLDVGRTATRTMKLHVRSYLAGGYTVQMVGSAPSYGEYTLATPLEPIAAIRGSEQFALNVVANTTPEVGEDPATAPGMIAENNVVIPKYGLSNMFAYVNGDIIARTAAESSQISYTVSMIVNVAGSTPAGHYSGDFSAIVTPVF